MKIYRKKFDKQPYQTVELPNGIAPLSVEAGKGFIALNFIGPDNEVAQYVTNYGLFVVKSGEQIPDDVRLTPTPHPLTQTVDPPNAHYIGSADDVHLFLGHPRLTYR